VLVAGLAALVSFLGLGLPELLNPSDARAMPVELRVALLIAMEAFMLLELGMAALVRLGQRRREAGV
jgi:hypothetical protein